ncbi:MAG: c-type cytochrome [Anaerolineaceae bacterium]|nr:c-type cytochrome [Anaerolineaceae bacterium]
MNTRKVLASVLFILPLAAILIVQSTAFAQTPNPPITMPTIGLLTPPPTVYPPAQADQGAQVYFYICMVCHGDKGQGLDAWRKELDPPDNNCFQSKCHAPNHMPDSFTFPHNVPPVVIPGLLQKFGNAQHLHDFMKSTMPWYAPGDLKDDEYWQLTAYLMRENGRDPGTQVLSPQTAASFDFTRPAPPPGPQPWVYALIGGLVMLVAGGGYWWLRRR